MEAAVKSTPPRPAAKRAKAAPKRPPARTVEAPAAKKAAAKVVEAVKAPKVAKVKKPKLVRDSFTIPKDEYGVLAELKQRGEKLAHPCKKSELLRAGIKALAAMSDRALLAALQAVPSIKTGRPKKA